MRVSAAMSPAPAASFSPPGYSHPLSHVVFPGSGGCYLNSSADKRHNHRWYLFLAEKVQLSMPRTNSHGTGYPQNAGSVGLRGLPRPRQCVCQIGGGSPPVLPPGAAKRPQPKKSQNRHTSQFFVLHLT
jgi:hypothetical protein